MKQLIQISVFELRINQKVYDPTTNTYGRISDIRETAPEWIEAFVEMGDGKETRASSNLNLVLAEEK